MICGILRKLEKGQDGRTKKEDEERGESKNGTKARRGDKRQEVKVYE